MDRAGPDEVPRTTESSGDEGVVDAAVLPAVERVQSLQAEGRDVVGRVIDDGYHHADAPQPGRMATARAGPALPPLIFSGKQATWKPNDGSDPRLTSRSICE